MSAGVPDFDWLYQIGTASFTISGYLIGAKKRFDLLGVCILALLTAIGGGMIRDVLVNSVPRIFLDASPLYTIFGTLALAWILRLQKLESRWLQRVFIVADSIGLVAFSLAGAQFGLALGLNAFGVAFLGFVTAVGGGLVRDMLCNDVPFILHEDFYGTVAILVAVLLYLCWQAGLAGDSMSWLLFAGGLMLRLWAHKSELRLPKIES
ncbi:trimeric intracellular cation channel family protein [Chitinilyticum litopenaei]|uniref:trimeric intracellular cation channel family protein n=1 Tax=Chitinilyticum litopenaei TaxID=1121276 RepID=UPI0004006B7F|nr:trimeric intracellular cation channel family protein [Chitinilyticum litopenaei]